MYPPPSKRLVATKIITPVFQLLNCLTTRRSLFHQPLHRLFQPGILLGLCIGSFLNVVIHRTPLILERRWKLESAELLGIEAEVAEEVTLSRPRSRCGSVMPLPPICAPPMCQRSRTARRCKACRLPKRSSS